MFGLNLFLVLALSVEIKGLGGSVQDAPQQPHRVKDEESGVFEQAGPEVVTIIVKEEVCVFKDCECL